MTNIDAPQYSLNAHTIDAPYSGDSVRGLPVDSTGPTTEAILRGTKQQPWRRASLTSNIPKKGPMDRVDAMKVFVTALDEGSLAAASRKLGRSPAAGSRATACLEGRIGVPLLHRSTRASKLSDVGERYAVICRRLLTALDEADTIAANTKSAPSGTLTITVPVSIGEDPLRPMPDDFLDALPTVSARLFLVDRPVNLMVQLDKVSCPAKAHIAYGRDRGTSRTSNDRLSVHARRTATSTLCQT